MHKNLNKESGFKIEKFKKPFEFYSIKKFIEKTYNSILESNYLNNEENNFKVENYHKLNISDENHKKIWSRENRRADSELINYILVSEFYKNLENIFGKLTLTEMVEKNKPDIFWRLVRPNKPNDVGPIHADSWFWKANNVSIPKDKKCLKLWMMISADSGPGLGIIPFSQNKKDWIYKTEFKDGLIKPVFDYENNKFSLKAMHTNLEEYILFNYDLLHSGLVNKSNNTRCSLEMTFFYSSL